MSWQLQLRLVPLASKEVSIRHKQWGPTNSLDTTCNSTSFLASVTHPCKSLKYFFSSVIHSLKHATLQFTFLLILLTEKTSSYFLLFHTSMVSLHLSFHSSLHPQQPFCAVFSILDIHCPSWRTSVSQWTGEEKRKHPQLQKKVCSAHGSQDGLSSIYSVGYCMYTCIYKKPLK